MSLVERGWADHVSLRTTSRILGALEAELDLVVRWRGGQVESLLDEGHAELVGGLARYLDAEGWIVQVEVSYAIGRELGSIDALALHWRNRALLVIEVKTELLSAEATLRKLDEKVCLAEQVVSDRFGWRATTVSRPLVLPATSTARAAADRHRAPFARAGPTRGWTLKRWLSDPNGSIAGLLFLQPTKRAGGMRQLTSRRRVRRPRSTAAERERPPSTR